MSDNINITLQGHISALDCGANIDELYGPYSTVEEAQQAINQTNNRYKSVGTTVGVINDNTDEIEEYWLQPTGGRWPSLVRKTLLMPIASRTTIGGIMTTKVEEEIAADEVFDTYIDDSGYLHSVVQQYDGNSPGIVPRYERGGDSTTRANMFLNSNGVWAPVFSANTINSPLSFVMGKLLLSFDLNSFNLGDNLDMLSLNQASSATLGGIKASNWSSGPSSGYTCCEAKLGKQGQRYNYNGQSFSQDSGKLYVYVPESSGGTTDYYSGPGIGIEGNQIYLIPAKSTVIGGVKADFVPMIDPDHEVIDTKDAASKASIGITGDYYIEVKKGGTGAIGTDTDKLYITTQLVLSVLNNKNTIGQLSDIDITDLDPGTNYSLVFDSESSRTTNNKLVIKAGNYITIQGTVDSELHLEDVGSYSDSGFPATTYVLVKTAGSAKFYFPPYDYEILQRDKGYLLKDTATVSKTDFDDTTTHIDTGKIGMTCNAGYYLITIFGNILQIDKLADKRDIDL